MITVNEIYLERESGKSKLCADVIDQERKRTLWFAVDSGYEEMLCTKGGECFIVGLLPYAMQNGQDISYRGKLSERFVHGLNEYLIPSIAIARENYAPIRICAAEFLPKEKTCADGVGVCVSKQPGFYKVLKLHGKESLYPLTHLCLVDASAEEFAERIAEEHELELVKLQHNCKELYAERTNDTDSFLNLAGALALSGGLKMFIYHSEHSLIPAESEPKESKNLDLILCSFASTDSMRIYLFDCEKESEDKDADH